MTWVARNAGVKQWGSVASSADGTKLVAVVSTGQGGPGNFAPIYVSTDSGVTWTPRENARNWSAVASSIDGTKLVAVGNSEPAQIYAVNSACVSCTSGQWLTRDLPPDSFDPVWSPDGNAIVCSNEQSSDQSHPDSFLISPFPSLAFVLRQRPVLTTGNTTAFSPSWSPDSSKLVYRTNFGDLFIVDADGTNPTLLVNHAVSGFSSLPDWAGSQ